MAKKLLSALLVLCMILSYAPMATYAAMPNDRDMDHQVMPMAAGDTKDNTIEITEGVNELQISKMVYYHFTAPTDGTVQLTVATSTGKWYAMYYPQGASKSYTTITDNQPAAAEVTQGTKVVLGIRIYDTSKWTAVAGTLTITVEFTSAGAACEHTNTEVRDDVPASCTENGYTGDTYCTECDAKVEAGQTIAALDHDYSEETGICSRCSAVDPTFCAHEHTEFRNGKEMYCHPTYGYDGYEGDIYCTDCDTKIGEGATIPMEHTIETEEYKAPTCFQDGNTEYTRCTKCYQKWNYEIIEARKYHVAGDPVIENETEESYQEVTYCVDCGTEMYRETIMKVCEHEGGEATCIAQAVCTKCGESYGELGEHNADGVITPVGATCTEPGVVGGTYCTVCEAGKEAAEEVIDALGHTPGNAVQENVTNASCTVAGSYESVVYCSVCGEELSRDVVTGEKLPHDYVGVVTTKPTQATTGVKTFTCDACNDFYTEDMPVLPQATVNKLGAMTYTGEYMVYDLLGNSGLSNGMGGFNMQVVMQFIAQDTPEQAAANYYGQYITDFYIEISGLTNGTASADGCYLAGYYEMFGGWVLIPLDGFVIENGFIYPVITPVGFGFTYEAICESVQNFTCGIYLSDEFLAANPNVEVNLSLGLSEDMDKALTADFFTVDGYTYNKADLSVAPVASVNGVKYYSLEEAIAAAEAGQTVTLLADANGNGIIINKNITIDLGGFTYTIDGVLVGSTGTKSLGFQILSGNTVKIMNGAIVMDEGAIRGHDLKVGNNFVIQNYADLTLENVAITGNSNTSYVVSINSGNVALTGNTSITAKKEGAVAFDVCKYLSYAEPVVTVAETVTINGKIEAAAKVGNVYFATLEKAVAAAEAGATVEMMANTNGNGIIINKNITINLGGFTYTIDGVLVGSTGTKSLGFQILSGNTVKIMNGAIVMDEGAIRGHDLSVGNNFVIQNYADLTLENVAITGNSYTSYVVSINSGNVALTGNTSITAKKEGAVAFDVCKYLSYAEPVVTVDTTGLITGIVEVTGGTLVIENGRFTTDVTEFLNGKHMVENDGVYTICTGTAQDAVKENEVAADCTNPGSYDMVTSCECGKELSRETITVDALGHTEEIVPGKQPTCTETGLTAGKKCSVCGETLVEQEEIPALGHDWAGATCTAPKTCKVCGATEGVALGHIDNDENNVCDHCFNTMNGINGDFYYEGGEKHGVSGLIKIDDAYYYVTNSGKVFKGGTRTLTAEQLGEYAAIFAEGKYTFDADGKMIVKEGIVDGFYYVRGQKCGVGGLVLWDDNYYYITESGAVFTDGARILNAEQLGDFTQFEAGASYRFYADGTMRVRSGVVDGFYYVNDKKTSVGGLIKIDDAYYYVTNSGKVFKGGTRTLTTEQLGDYAQIFDQGYYTFDAEGKMIVKEGIVDGFYYVRGQKCGVGGLVLWDDNYYYITNSGKVFVGTRKLSGEQLKGFEDIFADGRYTFGADGKMVNPPVKP